MADKGALQRQESWLGWWRSIPRLICDRHNNFLKFLFQVSPRASFVKSWAYQAPFIAWITLQKFVADELLHYLLCIYSLSVSQFSRSVMSESLQPHGLQHARLPCPSPTPGACSNSCQSSWWCYPNISSCHPLLLLPSIFPRISVFSNESIL